MVSAPFDLAQALEDRGIYLKHYRRGEHRGPCPECNRGKRDDALAVKIDHDGATWICHRCEFKGGIGPERTNNRPVIGSRPQLQPIVRMRTSCQNKGLSARSRPQPQPEPEQHVTLSPWGLDLWDACSSILSGTPAYSYLDRRCCIVPPGDLRWHAHLKDSVSGYRGPALVGLVTDALSCEPINLHRTWLAHDGSGKAPIAKPRRLLKGHRSKGVIRLWPDDDVTLGIVLGEGIETCLAAALEGLTPVWATMSAGNLAAFPVLPGLEGITILCDHDRPNPRTGKRAGIDAALALVQRYVDAGFDPDRDIKVILPPTEGQDAADLAGGDRHG